ncbi:hypothetical protein [Nocardioides humi]|uniref:hypothetical protein n=1 Tax=Nocardioides humi TaxID=449461 RepID=UPI0015E859E5|nr:hypothetical protein [Nocardioides humi]
MIPLHLGALHPVEQIATIVLAFGPFVVLGIVIAVRRRAEAGEDDDALLDDPQHHDAD